MIVIPIFRVARRRDNFLFPACDYDAGCLLPTIRGLIVGTGFEHNHMVIEDNEEAIVAVRGKIHIFAELRHLTRPESARTLSNLPGR
jgi:hypothetical protein